MKKEKTCWECKHAKAITINGTCFGFFCDANEDKHHTVRMDTRCFRTGLFEQKPPIFSK